MKATHPKPTGPANEAGLSDFPALPSAITRRRQDLYLVAFDLLHLNGHDLRDMPLKDRREILQALTPAGGHIQFSEALPGTGDAVYHLACEAGVEGIVSKRLDSGQPQRLDDELAQEVLRREGNGHHRVKRETGKAAMVLMADNGRYVRTGDRSPDRRLWASRMRIPNSR